MKHLCVGLATLVTAAAVAAPMSPKLHPRDFCGLAADAGYPSRPFNENTGTCATNMVDFGSKPGKNGMLNNIAYYSSGEYEAASRLRRLALILNINNVKEKVRASTELAKIVKALAPKVMGTNVPEPFAKAILSNGNLVWAQGDWVAEVKTTVWPTGLGLDTSVFFRPNR